MEDHGLSVDLQTVKLAQPVCQNNKPLERERIGSGRRKTPAVQENAVLLISTLP